jgi:hypothetical protein
MEGIIEWIELIGLIEFIELKVDSSWLLGDGARLPARGKRYRVYGLRCKALRLKVTGKAQRA